MLQKRLKLPLTASISTQASTSAGQSIKPWPLIVKIPDTTPHFEPLHVSDVATVGKYFYNRDPLQSKPRFLHTHTSSVVRLTRIEFFSRLIPSVKLVSIDHTGLLRTASTMGYTDKDWLAINTIRLLAVSIAALLLLLLLLLPRHRYTFAGRLPRDAIRRQRPL